MTTSQAEKHEAGVIGRTLRLMLGVLFAWMTYNVMRFEDSTFNILVLATLTGVTAVYVTLHFIISRYARDLHRWFGAIVVVAPVLLLFAFGDSVGRVVSVAYVGVSFLLQVIRADAGCEVMSIPGVLVGRHTHLMGVLFAPIDLVEKHLSGPGGLPG